MTDSFEYLTMLWVLCSRVAHRSEVTSLQLGEHGKGLHHAGAHFKTWRKDHQDRPLGSVYIPDRGLMDEAGRTFAC